MADDFFIGGGGEEGCFDGRQEMVQYRNFVFTSEEILKEMDMSGAELNLTGIELMCRVEKEAWRKVYPEPDRELTKASFPPPPLPAER
jgi:hypothetical protein